tara:strand:- start:38 stop:874 length:837 start_codon:yes stop_codon:yes gene_type:complete
LAEKEIKKFWAFCDLREEVRIKKESGQSRPWTSDPVLQRHKFTNINRIHDKGTKLLMGLCEDLSTYRKFCASAIYRFSGSNNALIQMMQNNKPLYWFDLLKSVTPLFNMTAYQANWPNGRGSGRNFMLKTLAKFCNSAFGRLEPNMGIIQTRDVLCDTLHAYKMKRMRFQTTEIAKDLSIVTNLVNPDSECPMNVGAVKGLKYIFGSTSSKNLVQLTDSLLNPGYNTQVLEHALCEYSKYRDYQTGVRKAHQKVYKPSQTTYNNNKVIINQTKEAHND